jgi:hypothetical protein
MHLPSERISAPTSQQIVRIASITSLQSRRNGAATGRNAAGQFNLIFRRNNTRVRCAMSAPSANCDEISCQRELC